MKMYKCNHFKKGISLVLAAFLGLSLVACGNSDASKSSKESGTQTGDGYVYVPEFHTLDVEDGTNINRVKVQGDEIYYTTYTYNEQTQESENGFARRKLSDLDNQELLNLGFEAPEGFDTSMGDFFFDSENNLYVMQYVSPVYVEGKEYNESDYKTYLIRYNSDMQKEWEIDMAEIYTEENRYIQNITSGGDGKLYLSSDNVIFVLDSTGAKIKTISVNTDWINGLTSTTDGRVFTVQYGNNGMEMVEIDTTKDAVGETFRGVPDSNNDIRPGKEGTLLVGGFSKLYEYDLTAMEATPLFSWVDCNIQGDYARDVSLLDDGRIVVFCDNYEGKPEIVILTKTEASQVPEKKILTIGTLYESNGSLQDAVVSFNKKNTEYQVKIKSYIDETAEWTETTYQDAINQFNADLVSDNCPDLMDLSMANLANLTAKGVLEDLTPYLENSKIANIDDFVPSALEAYHLNGIQATVPVYFGVNTLLARTSVVGEKSGWTMEDMLTLAKENPDAQLLHGMTKNTALQSCLRYASDSFIDYENGTCNFESPQFIQFLEFANCFPETYEYNPDESFPDMLQSGKVLLSDASFSDVHAYQMYYLMFEEDGVTPIGYPTSDGTPGVFLSGNETYGISSKTEYKDVAWSFIENVLAAEHDMYGWGFPSRKENLEKMFEEACKPDYQYDENGEIAKDAAGNPIEHPKTSWGYDNWNVDIYAASQEEIDGVRALIEIARPLSSESEEIYSIITEEAAPYFSGQKSAEETAKIIQSRVQIYVSENS